MVKSQKLMIIISLITLLIISACSTEGDGTPTQALRGAIVPTRVSTETPTLTSTPTATITPSSTPTQTITPSNTPTATITPSNTPTVTPSNTPTDTITPSNTPTLTSTPTITPSNTPTATDTSTPTLTMTNPPQDTPEPPPPTVDDTVPREPKAISYGASESETITQVDFEFRYTFDATAGDKVDIKMIAAPSTTLDPYILLLDDNDDVIAENDDDLNNTGRDSFLQGFDIPADGTYTIVATRFQQELGGTFGDFTLNLEQTPTGPGPQPDPNATPPDTDSELIEYGDVGTGEINDDTPTVEYSFEATANERVNIQMVSVDARKNLDPLLILVNENGDSLAENDDDSLGTGRDSFIRAFEIPLDGTYTIIATRFQQELGSTEGTFNLFLTLADAVDNINTDTDERLEYGDVHLGELTRDISEEIHLFDASEGDVVNIRLQANSGTLDGLLILQDEDGNELIRNDDDEQGIGRDSFIREFEIPADGTYIIIATRFQEEMGTTTGRFALTLEKVLVEA